MISFTIPYPPTKKGKAAFCKRFGLNAYYAGKHWSRRNEDARDFHNLTVLSMRKAGVRRQLLPYAVVVRFYWNDGYDIDNHAVMGKYVVDAMKGYVLQNDSRRWLKEVTHRFWEGDGILVEVERYG